jgi:hypothetical protein
MGAQMAHPTPAHSGDPLHDEAVEAATSVVYWRGVAARHAKGSRERRHALRLARYGEGRVVDLAIRAETEARGAQVAA